MPTVTPSKGKPIIFTGGSYAGKRGWLNSAQPYSGGGRIAVIVDLGGGVLTSTKVETTSIRSADFTPSNYGQACFAEHNDILAGLRQVSNKLAACRLHEEDIVDVQNIFGRELRDAIGRQAKKSPKACWFDIKFKRNSAERKRSASSRKAPPPPPASTSGSRSARSSNSGSSRPSKFAAL